MLFSCAFESTRVGATPLLVAAETRKASSSAVSAAVGGGMRPKLPTRRSAYRQYRSNCERSKELLRNVGGSVEVVFGTRLARQPGSYCQR